MRLAVVGTGKMGTALGERLAAAGHEVRVGSRDPERGRRTAAEIGASFGGDYREAADGAEAVVLAVPWSAASESLALLGKLDDAILVDVTNPTVKKDGPLVVGSGAEQIAARVPGMRVVKAWNTLYSEVVRRGPEFDGTRATVFVAGDDDWAKKRVSGLVRDLGYEPADAGPLTSSRFLEPLAGLMTALDKLGGGRYEHALKLLRRAAPARRRPRPKAQTARGTSSKRSTSTRPRSVIFRAGTTERARKASI